MRKGQQNTRDFLTAIEVWGTVKRSSKLKVGREHTWRSSNGEIRGCRVEHQDTSWLSYLRARSRSVCVGFLYSIKQEAFEKCWAHSPLRAAARRLFYIAIHHVSLLSHAATVARHLRVDVHNNIDDNNNDNAWQRTPLWPHGMGPIRRRIYRCSYLSLRCMSMYGKYLE